MVLRLGLEMEQEHELGESDLERELEREFEPQYEHEHGRVIHCEPVVWDWGTGWSRSYGQRRSWRWSWNYGQCWSSSMQ